jgi:hypothetical protein
MLEEYRETILFKWHPREYRNPRTDTVRSGYHIGLVKSLVLVANVPQRFLQLHSQLLVALPLFIGGNAVITRLDTVTQVKPTIQTVSVVDSAHRTVTLSAVNDWIVVADRPGHLKLSFFGLSFRLKS